MSQLDKVKGLVETLAPGGRLISRRRLRGGLGSQMDVLRIEAADRVRQTVVLRRYVSGWERSSSADARHEYAVIELLEKANVPAPRRLLLDAEGRFFDMPAMVLSYLPGRSFFVPRNVRLWTDELARGLAQVHSVTPSRFNLSWLLSETRPDLRARVEQRSDQVADLPPLGQRAVATLRSHVGTLFLPEPCLVHGDYWPGNTVSYRGKLVGIIDWSEARLGDRRSDISQCRADLVLTHGLETADDFLESYRRYSPETMASIEFFDLLMGLRALAYYKTWLRGYRDAGHSHIDWNGAEDRLTQFTERAIHELGP